MSDAPPSGGFSGAVELARRGLRLDASDGSARSMAVRAGALDHFRVPARHWRAALAAVRSLGFTLVETAVPWGLHERGGGKLDFTGARDLGAFLDACAGEGLGAIVRVGPRTGGELSQDGLPGRIVTDAAMQARTAAGAPSWVIDFPRAWVAPSYASKRFLDEARGFYRALGEVMGPRLAPRGGPVALLDVDHALGGFYRAGPFDLDYHDDAIARWHDEEGAAPPPRAFEAKGAADLAPLLRWLAFRERSASAALTALGALLDEAGLDGVPRLHGFAAIDPVVYDVALAERAVAAAGAHFLGRADDYLATRRRALYLAGASRLPLGAPIALGSTPWDPLRTDGDSIASLLGALMHGVAGYRARMAVARDRWIGAPIEEDGSLRPGLADPLRKIHAALDAAGWLDLDRPADVGLLVPRDYARLAFGSSRLGPLSHLGELLHLEAVGARSDPYGLAGPVAVESRTAATVLASALSRAHLPFVLLDDHAPDERLAACRLLVVPTFDFLAAPLADRLRAYAGRGGRILSGPRAPALDAAMQQADVAPPGGRFEAALLAEPAALADTLAAAARAAGCRFGPTVTESSASPGTARITPHPAASGAASASHAAGAAAGDPVDVTVYHHPDGRPALLFAANPSREPRTATVALPAGAAVEDVLSGERPSGESPAIALGPFGVRVFSIA